MRCQTAEGGGSPITSIHITHVLYSVPLVPSQVVSAPSHTLTLPCIVASREYCYPLHNKLAALDAASSLAVKETLPVSLQGITTPLKLEYWQQQLNSHPQMGNLLS